MAGVTLLLTTVNRLPSVSLQVVQFDEIILHVVHSLGHMAQEP